MEILIGGLRRILSRFPALAIIGAYWGDEGKGKIVDLCAALYDLVVRFKGGNGAGHTVEVDGRKFAFHLLPSGFASGKTCILAGGVLLKVQALAQELEQNMPNLQGPQPPVLVDGRCPLWTPYHGILEAYIEKHRGGEAIGTTGRAMGPMAGIHDLREGPIAIHLREPETLFQSVDRLHRILRPLFGEHEVPDPQSVTDELLSVARSSGIVEMIIDTGAYLFEALTRKELRALFEGAQGTGLSIDAGTWPHVTGTQATAGGISTGTLLPPRALSGTLLAGKLFPTRVGAGYMPGEFSTRHGIQHFLDTHPDLFVNGPARDTFLAERLAQYNSGTATSAELGEYIMVKARERGVSTGRGRSPGRPDLAWLRYAIRVNDPFALALTCLDIASGLREIEVVAGYRYQGALLPPGQVPVLELHNVEPVIERWPGWEQDITGLTEQHQLSREVLMFIERVEAALGRPIMLIGTGADRKHMILRPPTEELRTFFM